VVNDDVQKTEETVTQEATDDFATLDDVKSWPQKRLDEAEVFEVPGTGKKFLIAKADMATAYHAVSVQLHGMTDDQSDWVEKINTVLLKSCVVKPKLDDEAIEALNNSDVRMVQAVIEKCREVSGLDEDTEGVENFISTNQ